MSNDAAVAAIEYALGADEGMEFLRSWMQGDFDVVRAEWPDCPEEVFNGAEVKRGEAMFFKARATSVDCPYCQHEHLDLLGDPRGKSIDCEGCGSEFFIPEYSVPEIE